MFEMIPKIMMVPTCGQGALKTPPARGQDVTSQKAGHSWGISFKNLARDSAQPQGNSPQVTLSCLSQRSPNRSLFSGGKRQGLPEDHMEKSWFPPPGRPRPTGCARSRLWSPPSALLPVSSDLYLQSLCSSPYFPGERSLGLLLLWKT